MNDKKQDRPESFPKPTEMDTQLKNQDEYVEEREDEGAPELVSHPNLSGTEQQQEKDKEAGRDI